MLRKQTSAFLHSKVEELIKFLTNGEGKLAEFIDITQMKFKERDAIEKVSWTIAGLWVLTGCRCSRLGMRASSVIWRSGGKNGSARTTKIGLTTERISSTGTTGVAPVSLLRSGSLPQHERQGLG
eukprot:766873-Hanusia_phi.AAC.4